MQKERYEKPDMEIIMLNYEDVIKTSDSSVETPIDPANLNNVL